MIEHAYLRSIISYDPGTGVFVWIKARPKIVVGARAGTIDKDGYRVIKIRPKVYRAGRLAVFYMTGKWPPEEVDHRNLIKDDDSWDNLRCAGHGENGWNRRVRSDSSTGHKCIQQEGNKFVVRVASEGKRVVDESFETIEAAISARDTAILQNHGEFGRT